MSFNETPHGWAEVEGGIVNALKEEFGTAVATSVDRCRHCGMPIASCVSIPVPLPVKVRGPRDGGKWNVLTRRYGK
jgi:hypothetical protein